jgi:hypothetical protein
MDFNGITPYDNLLEKWSDLIDMEGLPSITDVYRRRNTAVLLENQYKANREGGQEMLSEGPATNFGGGGFSVNQAASPSGNLAGYDPILISLVRRAMPNVVAYDIASVQPMSAPTGLIFAFRSRYASQTGVEAMYDEPNAGFAGASGGTFAFANTTEGATYLNPFGLGASSGGWTGSPTRKDLFSRFRGFLTSDAERLGMGGAGDGNFAEMAFSIERVAVQARTRALKAEYTTELAQDLKAVHGLDAEAELANILSVEILNEINREILRAAYTIAKDGSQQADLKYTGSYDMLADSDGRWSAERYRGLMFQIEREANVIAKDTRRGKGNFLLASSDVVSALAMGGFLNLTPAVQNNLSVDDTGNVFAGVLNGRYKVYIDPFVPAGVDFFMVGYKGVSPYDAGMYYCPYVPLQMVRAVGQDSFQPKIGFKTRYGLVANPFAKGRDQGPVGLNALNDGLTTNSNVYYRLTRVVNLHGIAAGGTA